MERNRIMSDFFFLFEGEHTASTIPKNTHTHTLKSEHMQEPKGQMKFPEKLGAPDNG